MNNPPRVYHRSSSLFANIAAPTLKTSQLLVYFSTSVSHILKQSHGRDKILGLIQNISDLYKQCMLEYLSLYHIREWPLSVRNAQALQVSMKSGRKFFRLLRWLEEMSRVEGKLKQNLKPVILLQLIRHIAGVWYYFLDNLMWIIQIGILSEPLEASSSRLESTKDALSLTRYILRIVIFLMTSHSKAGKERQLRMELLAIPGRDIRMNSSGYTLTCRVIKARSKRRFQAIEMMINIFRVIMLLKSLKLPGSKKISNVFYSVCGVISGALALFKLLTHKSSPVINYSIS